MAASVAATGGAAEDGPGVAAEAGAEEASGVITATADGAITDRRNISSQGDTGCMSGRRAERQETERTTGQETQRRREERFLKRRVGQKGGNNHPSIQEA